MFFIISTSSGFWFHARFLIMYSTYEVVHNLCLSVPKICSGVNFMSIGFGVGIFVKKMLLASFACMLNKDVENELNIYEFVCYAELPYFFGFFYAFVTWGKSYFLFFKNAKNCVFTPEETFFVKAFCRVWFYQNQFYDFNVQI